MESVARMTFPCFEPAYVAKFSESGASKRGTQKGGNQWERYWNWLDSVP